VTDDAMMPQARCMVHRIYMYIVGISSSSIRNCMRYAWGTLLKTRRSRGSSWSAELFATINRRCRQKAESTYSRARIYQQGRLSSGQLTAGHHPNEGRRLAGGVITPRSLQMNFQNETDYHQSHAHQVRPRHTQQRMKKAWYR